MRYAGSAAFRNVWGTAPAREAGAAAGFLGWFVPFWLWCVCVLITEATTSRVYMKGMISRHSSSPCQVGEGRHIRLI